MYEEKVEELANKILRETINHLNIDPSIIIEDKRLLNEHPFAKVDAISRASRVICREGYSFEAEVDVSSQIPVIKYRVFKK